MRTKKASINIAINSIAYIIGFLPSFIVRKVFLDTLGNDMLGLSSLYLNIIGLFSIIEMGIGSAIIFSLYKPYAENNIEKMQGYLSFYKKFYIRIGSVIFAAGLLFIPFLNIFVTGNINNKDAIVYFILFLINTVITYLFSYKLCILNVAQEEFRVSLATTTSRLVISILQLILLKIYGSFALYILAQTFVSLLYFMFMNMYISKRYSWSKVTNGSLDKEEKEDLTIRIKALFIHKIASLVVFSTDNIVISYFLNLASVARYNSYNMIITTLQGLINSGLSGVTASIGNLLVDDDADNAYNVHKRLFFMNFWIVSLISISLFNTIDQFIIIWLGDSQIIDKLTVGVILINFYFLLMRGSVERFKEAAGIYHQDRFAPLAEALINLVASVYLVNKIGLLGVFVGTFLSNILVVFWIKPKMVYKYVFKRSCIDYFKLYFQYLLIAVIPLCLTYLLTNRLQNTYTFLAFTINGILNVTIINFIYLIIFRKNKEYIFFKDMIIRFIARKK